MGFLDKLSGLKGGNVELEEYLDALGLEEEDLLDEHADVWVKPVKLTDMADVDTVEAELSKGNIVLLNIEMMYKRNTSTLRQAVARLKSYVQSINGDIARISDYKILVTPTGIKISKR